MEKLIETIKDAAQRRNMRNVELAQRVGVSRSYITKFFKGEVTPSPEILKSFAKVLEIPEDIVFMEAGILTETKEARSNAFSRQVAEEAQGITNPEHQAMLKEFIQTLKKLSGPKRK